MTVYQQIITGTNISQFVGSLNTNFEAVRSMERGANASEPAVKVTGLLWNRTDYPALGEAVLRWDGAEWDLILDPDHPQVNAGGTVPFAAHQSMGGFKLFNLGQGSASGESVRFDQVILKGGLNDFTANQSMGGFRLTNVGAPTQPTDAARLQDISASVNMTWIEDVVIRDFTDQANTYNDLGFAPDYLRLRMYCLFRDQSDFDTTIAEVDEEFDVYFWRSDAAGGFVGNDVETQIFQIQDPVGSKHCNVIVTRKTSAPKGFFLQVVRDDNGEWQEPREFNNNASPDYVIQAIAYGGGS